MPVRFNSGHQPRVLGGLLNSGDDPIDGKYGIACLEEVSGVRVEQCDAAFRLIEGYGAGFAQAHVGQRQVAKNLHLLFHLLLIGGGANDVGLGYHETRSFPIHVSFEADIITEFGVVQDQSLQILGWKQLPGDDATDLERGEVVVKELDSDSRCSRMGYFPPAQGCRVEGYGMFAMFLTA